MKKRVRRILSVILTAVMIFALLPVIGNPMVVKAEDTPAEHVAHDEQDTDGSYHKGWTQSLSKALEEDNACVCLTHNVTLSDSIRIPSGKTLTICLNGHNIESVVSGVMIYNNGTLNIYDLNENTGTIFHRDGIDGIGVVNSGTFTMYGGTISNNKRMGTFGGGVYNEGTFIMNGGTISGNNCGQRGGGVYNAGTFIMNGGTIKGNESKDGGGVFNYIEATFEMNGGKISGNIGEYGGGVDNHGTFTMNDGTISDNLSDYAGGINNSNYGTFTMNGGTIENNKVEGSGGGVISTGNLAINGGTIAGNKAQDEVDGLYFSTGVNRQVTIAVGTSIDQICGPIPRTVTFKANDGTNREIVQYLSSYGDATLIPNQFKFKTSTFNGWNTEPDGKGTSYNDNATISIDGDLTLYAMFKKVSYDVNFVVNNGSWSDGTNDKKTVTVWRYEDEDKVLELKAQDIPSLGNPDTGYKIGNWETEPDTVHLISSNITYTYNFEPINYIIKYDANGGAGTIDDQSRTYDDKAPLTTNTFTFEGKTFNGWNTAADGSGTSYADEEVNNLSSTDGDTVTLYAQWTIDTFTITWKDYNGTVLETDTDVAYGTTPTFDGEPPKRDNAGNIKYTFSGWTPAVDTIKGAATYTATYSEEEIEEPTKPTEPTEPTTPEEPTNPTTPEEPTEPTTPEEPTKIETPEEPQEPTEPEVPEITEPEPDPEIPEKDWLDDLRLALGIAAELGGPQTVEYSGDFALSYDIMQYLVEHTDITLIYTVTYEGQEYTITIPAGKAIADPNIGWYGPLWLLANYGGDKVPEIQAGSGKYIVVAGDTLSGIAEKFNTTVEELAKKNGIKNPNYIIVGQVIVY